MVLLKQLQRLYTGGSIFKYHQYIIIAPVVILRNFLYIFFVLQFYSLYISFIFYGFIKATTEAVHKWFHFSSTASV